MSTYDLVNLLLLFVSIFGWVFFIATLIFYIKYKSEDNNCPITNRNCPLIVPHEIKKEDKRRKERL